MYLFTFLLFFVDLLYIQQFADAILQSLPRDFSVEPLRYEAVPGETETLADYSCWDFTRHGRDIFLDGNYTFALDMDNTFVHAIESYYSVTGSDFQRMPFTLPEENLCDYYNTSYRKYVEPHFLGKTNFPALPAEGFCPIPKGNYWAQKVQLNDNVLPKHLPKGYWRVEERFYKTLPTRSCVGGLNVYVKVVDRA